MKYATIKTVDIANGTGVRVSLFVSGCTHRCPECFNEIAWDFNYGQEFNQETIDLILKALKPSHIAGLTLLGGEPMELVNQEGLLPLLQQVRKMYPDKDIWCYTGYLYEDLLPGGKVHGPYSDEILSYLDILVDGPFILAQKNIRLKFRGSENQRIIDVKRTNQSRQIVLWDEK
ncbi:anaerobic ribonucleoside-triphosphate reductase activating protein [Massilimicrobiota sp. An80]|uniref:anaerobic ribonucleoside-triphosphate reductase activating protein n=1 Tax=Massilimicrobiota sp. An80 TaxID=1965658 RepID=UPI000B430935|nr:anaerobic ribonucleoside-triphosphate reductase activating protein [Massilimicrobiota sp. An80]OUN34814.1 anaerobic ribonucleoside-triphosphate reductase activating protein [Massilimicrobiota sp. An80]